MTHNKDLVVYGIFQNRLAAEQAIDKLKNFGFRNTDVSVLFSDTNSSKEFVHQKGSKAPEGTAVGLGTGVAVGGALGWLAGIGALAIPAVGPLIAAGPIMGLLAGAGVGGAMGGLLGGLMGLGIPEYEAKRFEGLIREGGVLLSVHCDNNDWVKKAKRLLQEAGGRDISSTSEAKADVKVDEHNRILKSA